MDDTSFIPLYVQLRELLRKQIREGVYSADEELPSEHQICNEFKVSRATVRRALDDLTREGLIERKRGKGTFVKVNKIRQDLFGELSFAKEIMAMGMVPRSKVLNFSIGEAKAGILKQLGLAENEKVVEVRRLRYANDEPLIIENLFIPEKYVPGIESADFENEILYELLVERFHINIGTYDTEIEPIILSQKESEELRVDYYLPALLITRTVYSEQNNPIVLSKRIVRGDRCQYVVKLR